MLDELLLYDASDSPFCLKARICLQVKGVPFRRVTVTLGRLRELRRLSPPGRVPVLVHAPEVIAGSSRIARHLDARYPEPALIPDDPAARAYAALLEEWADEALHSIVCAFKWLNPENRPAALANTVTEMTGAALRPVLGRLLARRMRRRHGARGHSAATLGDLRDRMRGNLAVLAELLVGKRCLLGRAATLADVAVFSQLVWMRRYAEGRLLDESPGVVDWLEQLASLPPIAAALSS
jgi:glutathione S-transferase